MPRRRKVRVYSEEPIPRAITRAVKKATSEDLKWPGVGCEYYGSEESGFRVICTSATEEAVVDGKCYDVRGEGQIRDMTFKKCDLSLDVRVSESLDREYKKKIIGRIERRQRHLPEMFKTIPEWIRRGERTRYEVLFSEEQRVLSASTIINRIEEVASKYPFIVEVKPAFPTRFKIGGKFVPPVIEVGEEFRKQVESIYCR